MTSTLDEHSLTELEIQECPWDYYGAMHEQGFYFDEPMDMFICANYALMREIMRNTKVFSNVNSQNISHMRTPPAEVLEIQAESIRPVNILVSSDPPEHTRIRSLLDEPFRPREIAKLRPQIQNIVNHTIDRFISADQFISAGQSISAGQGTFDAVEDFSIPIPVTVIADLLGLPRDKSADIKAWSDASVEPLGMMLTDQRWIECARCIKDFQDYIASELEARVSRPGQDLLTHLVRARDDNDNALSLGEMLGITQQLLVAGNETTTNGIAAGIQLLIDNPEQQALLRAEPSRVLVFVNEVLRLESPVQGLFRIALEDTELAGIPVVKGSRIMLRYAAANRDPKKFERPDQLDVCRKNAGTHVGFGAGIHHCIGANLAREEMVQAFTILLDRVRDIRYKEGANDFSHHPSMILRGLKKLDVEFELS
jgi:cytochrome P450